MAYDAQDLLVYKGSTLIAAVTQKSVNWQGQPIDITSDDSAGDSEYLSTRFANTSLTIEVELFAGDNVFWDAVMATGHAAKFLSDIRLVHPNGDQISGNWIITNYRLTGAGEAATETATLIRNAIHTFTAA